MFLDICEGGGAGALKLTRYKMDWSEHCKSYCVCVGAAGSLSCNSHRFGPSSKHLFLLSPGECQRCEAVPDTFAIVCNLVHTNRPVLHGQYNPVEGGSARYSYQGPGERQSQEGPTNKIRK